MLPRNVSKDEAAARLIIHEFAEIGGIHGTDEMACAIVALVREEREACAKVAEDFDGGKGFDWYGRKADETADEIAAAIRARGDT